MYMWVYTSMQMHMYAIFYIYTYVLLNVEPVVAHCCIWKKKYSLCLSAQATNRSTLMFDDDDCWKRISRDVRNTT